MRSFALALVILLVAAGAVAAQGVVGSIAVNGRAVPLPPGTWRPVAELQVARNETTGLPVNGMNTQLALLRLEGGRVDGLVTISTSREPSNGFAGWGTSAECRRTDYLAVHVEANAAREQDCWTLTHVVMVRGRNASALADRYFAAAAEHGGMPPTMLRVTSRRADALHFLTVAYHFVPDPGRFPPATEAWSVNPWHRDRLDAERAAYIRRFEAWGALAQEAVSRGFAGGAVLPLPAP